MGLKVYGPAKATNVVRVLVSLEEVGAEYELVPVDFATGEHRTAAHLARNPFGQVPSFRDDDEDVTLFESRAISRYILRKYKSDLLREDNLKEAALVDAWLDAEYGQYNAFASAIIYNVIVKPMQGETADQRVVDKNLEKVKKVLEVYEARLSECKYLARDFVNFADLSHFPCVYYPMSTRYGSVFEPYPHVTARWKAIMARPSIEKPFGQVPAFQDDDFTIFESRAIARYILHKYNSDLLPQDELKKSALVDVWLDVESCQYNEAVSPIIYNVMVTKMLGGTCNQQIVDANLEKLKKILEVYEARLSQCKYLAGDFISLADLSHFPYTYYFLSTQYGSLFDSYLHIKAWWEAILSRPAIKKVIRIMSHK